MRTSFKNKSKQTEFKYCLINGLWLNKQMSIIVTLVYQMEVANSSLYSIVLKDDNGPLIQFYLWLNCLLWPFFSKNSTTIKCQPSPIPNWGNPNNQGFNQQMLSILEFNSLNSKSQNKLFRKNKDFQFLHFFLK